MLYTPLKKGVNLQSKDADFEKFTAACSAAKLLLIFSSALCSTTWPLHLKFASYAYECVSGMSDS